MSTVRKETLIGCILLAERTRWAAWQVELTVEDDEEHTGKALPDSHFQKTTRIGDDWRRKEKWDRDSDKFFAERDGFKDRLVGKTFRVIRTVYVGQTGLSRRG